jgi:acetoin utilization deacetylase AcuC-like enzyme
LGGRDRAIILRRERREPMPPSRSEPIFIHAPTPPIDIGAHVFPTEKYARLAAAIREMGVPDSCFGEPEAVATEDLARVHTPEYLADCAEARTTGRTLPSELPVRRDVIAGFRAMVGGTTRAADLAWAGKRWTMHLGGGFHHAFADHAEGFCYFHDVAVAIRRLRMEGDLRRCAVIDTDLHQGNGTAAIFAEEPEVFTFSIHQEKLYPLKQSSDLDIGLDQFVGDDEYLDRLEEGLDRVFAHAPELIAYVAGADPFHDDQLGDLKLTFDGLRRRDRLVIERAAAAGIPGFVTLAGGYARRVEDTVRIHAQTAETVWETCDERERERP